MTSKHYFSLALVGIGLVTAGLCGVGCGGGGGTGGSASSNGGATSSSSHSVGHTVTSSTTSSGGGTGGTGGTGGGGNHDPSSATPVDIDGAPVMATLVDASTPDFYTFTTTMPGERVYIAMLRAGATQSFDPTAIDPAFGLYDSAANAMTGTALTYQSGAWPSFSQDAQLFVELANPGTYYVRLNDCNGFFSMGCPNPASGITNLDYTFVVAHTSKLNSPEVLADNTMQDGTTAKAQAITYKKGQSAGTYVQATIGGDFKTATSTHVFSFTPPTDAVPMAGAVARAEFFVQNIGSYQGGDLSDANVKAWITDSTGNVIVSSVDQNNYPTDSMSYSPLNLSAVVTPGTQYYLFVQNTQTMGSVSKDFYFIEHYLNAYYDYAEKEGPTVKGMNDTSATAETLPGLGSGKTLYVADGNLSSMASDVDYYGFKVPGTVKNYQIQCDAQRSGSGLRGFTVTLYGSDGTTKLDGMTETATADLITAGAPLPSGVTSGTQLFLAMTATSQDATDTGTQYRCFFIFY